MHSNGTIFNFNHFRGLVGFIRYIYSGEYISLEQAIEIQNEIGGLLRSLNDYKPKKNKKNYNLKMESWKMHFDRRRQIVIVFEK